MSYVTSLTIQPFFKAWSGEPAHQDRSRGRRDKLHRELAIEMLVHFLNGRKPGQVLAAEAEKLERVEAGLHPLQGFGVSASLKIRPMLVGA